MFFKTALKFCMGLILVGVLPTSTSPHKFLLIDGTPPPSFPLGSILVISGGFLNLRDGVSLESKIIDAMAEGSIVIVLDGPVFQEGVEWYKVDYNGKQGWASRKYLKLASLQNTADANPTAPPVEVSAPEINSTDANLAEQPAGITLPTDLNTMNIEKIIGIVFAFMFLYSFIKWISKNETRVKIMEFMCVVSALSAVGYLSWNVYSKNITFELVALAVYFINGIITFIAYGFDKRMAVKGKYRISESGLHLMEMLGGWAGAFLAQKQFRHKTVDSEFRSVYWTIVISHIVFWGWWIYTS